MTAPTIPPNGHNPASPGQRQAARDHVTTLLQHGWTYRSIAAAAALSPDTVHALATGTQESTARHGHRRPHAGPPHPVRVTAGRGRHPAAAAGPARHGPRLGPHRPRRRRPPQNHPQARPRRRPHRSAPSCATPIIAVYDAWWDKRAPARTRSERAAATAARNRAIAGNWCAAAALDDDLLDLPGYLPRQGWMPATGTGTAPDIYPPARLHRKSRA